MQLEAWSKDNDECSSCLLFFPSPLRNGRLPTLKAVLCYYFHLCSTDDNSAELNVTLDLMNHWRSCNVYTQTRKWVQKRLSDYTAKYKYLKNYLNAKRKDTYWKEYYEFVTNCEHLFDIIGSSERIKAQENVWKVKMTTTEYEFHKNMCSVPQIGYSGQTDKAWEKTDKRKREEMERLERKRREADEHECSYLSKSNIELSDEDMDMDWEVPEETDEYSVPAPSNSEKYVFNSSMIDDGDDDMPYRFRHIRSGLRSVRPEYYVAMHKLKSEFHMSENQAQGAICTVANLLFERKDHGEWKRYEKQKPSDYNTLPAPTNTNKTEAYVEALILAGITHEIMSPDTETVVTYSNDGSAQSGIGNYIVQSFSINGKQRALPTMSIFTESRSSLKEMQLMTYKMLAAATGWKYTEKEIVSKIDFVITDSTAHNLGVIEDVCENLEVQNVPDSLVCHVHPMMMFQRKVKDVFQEIHDAFGTGTIKDCFITDVDFRNESFIYKAIGCLSSFINSEYSAKP